MAKTAQEKADLKAEKLYEKTHKRKYRLKPGDIVFNILNYLFFTLFTIACIFPFYYLFINTISDNDLYHCLRYLRSTLTVIHRMSGSGSAR